MNLAYSRFTLVAFNLREQRIIYRQDNAEKIDFAAIGKAVQAPTAGTVNYHLLQDKQSETHFITKLLTDQLGPQTVSPDAIIICGAEGYARKEGASRSTQTERRNFESDLLPELQLQPDRRTLSRHDRIRTQSIQRGLLIQYRAPARFGKRYPGHAISDGQTTHLEDPEISSGESNVLRSLPAISISNIRSETVFFANGP